MYLLGVLVLEIISGKRNKGVYFSRSEEYLLGKAWNFWTKGEGLQVVDASLDCSIGTADVLRCMKVGLLCVQESPEDRPTMSSVVLMLGGDSDHALLPEPKQPGFVARKHFLTDHSSSKMDILHSVNGVTITMLVGR
ncbi:receptor-like serine/threonine-protein kinase SD1-8 [Asparagus officinalis]|uniref:receptor-like serine/threonine-protein kinase SD1-8 n=1 Tax=Asparagus officinalis TaxID=4686 RepID=UPI00098E2D82|nr:receptor-like serine/threonine-protein kinase SD1-8 [Asparagus officinalis]